MSQARIMNANRADPFGIRQLSPTADAIVSPQASPIQQDAIGSPSRGHAFPVSLKPADRHGRRPSASSTDFSWNPLLPSPQDDDGWFHGIDQLNLAGLGGSPSHSSTFEAPIFGYGINAWGTGFQSSQDTSESPRPPDQSGSGKHKREVSLSPSPRSWAPGPRSVPTSYNDYLQQQGAGATEDRQAREDRRRRAEGGDVVSPRPYSESPRPYHHGEYAPPEGATDDRLAREDRRRRTSIANGSGSSLSRPGGSSNSRQSPSLSHRPQPSSKSPALSPSPRVPRRTPSPGGKPKKPSHNRGSSWSARKSDSETWRYELDIAKVLSGEDTRTALMVKNVPNKYNQEMLLEAVNEQHKGLYDFFYLPIDFKNKCNVGYAFINFIDPQQSIPSFYQSFNQKKWLKFNSSKVCQITYARIQGKASFIEHFRNSSLMHEDPKCRPVIFYSYGPNRGLTEPFPIPSPTTQKKSTREEGIFAFDEDSDIYNENSDYEVASSKDGLF